MCMHWLFYQTGQEREETGRAATPLESPPWNDRPIYQTTNLFVYSIGIRVRADIRIS